MTCKERFLKYIAVSTASDEDSTESPSTTRQLELSRRLAEEMLSLGLKNVHMDSCGNAIGHAPRHRGRQGRRNARARRACGHRSRRERRGRERPRSALHRQRH